MSLSRKSIERLLEMAIVGSRWFAGPAIDPQGAMDDKLFLDRCRKELLPTGAKPKTGRGRRQKGQRGEREAAKFLADQGFPEAARGLGQARGGGKEVADCINVGCLHVEVKRVEKLNLGAAMEQAERDAAADKTPVVLHRRNNHPWLVTVPAEAFFRIFRESEHCAVYDPTLDVDKEKENA